MVVLQHLLQYQLTTKVVAVVVLHKQAQRQAQQTVMVVVAREVTWGVLEVVSTEPSSKTILQTLVSTVQLRRLVVLDHRRYPRTG